MSDATTALATNPHTDLYPYEANIDNTGTGVLTNYGTGYPLPQVVEHPTDAVEIGQSPDDYLRHVDLDVTIGGTPGLVDRNSYVLHGIDSYVWHGSGDGPTVPRRNDTPAYGPVGTQNYPEQYAMGIAANDYPDVTPEQSWAEVSGVI